MTLRRSFWQAMLRALRLPLSCASNRQLRRRRVPVSWQTPALVQPVESKVLLSGVTALGPEQQVNVETSGDQQSTSAIPQNVAVDAAGNYVITWTSQDQDGDGYGVYARRFDASGNPLGDEFLVNTTTASYQLQSVVSMNDSGEFVIAWRSADDSSWGVYARRYDASGHPLGDEFLVNTTTTGVQDVPGISLNNAGEFVITWTSNVQDGSGFGVYAQRFDASGNKLGGEILVNQTTAGDQDFSSVSLNDAGQFVVAWHGNGQDGDDWGVHARRFDASGNPLGDEFLVNQTTVETQNTASVSLNAAGEFVIAWMSSGQDGDSGSVYARRYDAGGNSLGDEFLVNTTTVDDQRPAAVSLNESGEFVITWASDNQDGSGYGVYAQVYAADGQRLGGEFQVNTVTTNRQNFPAVSLNESGEFVIAWNSDGQDGDSYGVYARRYRIQQPPVAVGSEHQVNTFTLGSQLTTTANQSQIGIDARGNYVITWLSSGQDGSEYGVYAQRFDARGNKLGGEIQVNSTTAGQQLEAAISMNDAGEFVITWSSNGQDGSEYGVYAQRFDAHGNKVGDEFLVNTTTSRSQLFSTVSLNAAGEFVITWSSHLQDGSDYGVYARRFDSTGNPLGDEFLVNQTTASDQMYSTVSLNDAGEFVISWTSLGQDGSEHGVYARRFDAGGHPVGDEFRVNTATDNIQDHSTVSLNDAGQFVIAWTSFGQDGSNDGIYAQRFDAGGNKLGGEFRVNTHTADNQEQPSVSLNDAGEFVISWGSNGQDGSGWGVYAQAYDADGYPLGDEFRVNTTTANNQDFSSVSLNHAGQFVIVWTSENQDGSFSGVYAQRFKLPRGQFALGTEHQVNQTTAGNQLVSFETPGSVGVDARGNYVVTWNSVNQDGSESGVYARRYDASGNPLSDEFLVNQTTFDNQVLSTVSLNAAGEFVITWSSEGQDGSGYGIYARRYDASGNPLSDEFLVNQTTASDQRLAAVSLNDAGEFVITWSSFGQDGSNMGVYARRFDSSGNPLGDEFLVNQTTASDQLYSRVSLNAAGQFVISWTSFGQDGSNYGVYARRYDAGGNALGDEFRVNQTTVLDQFYSTVSLNDAGEFVISWTSNGQDGSNYGVYARRFDSSGNPLDDEFLVNQTTFGSQIHSTVSLNAAGQFVISWTSFGQDGSGNSVYARRYDAGGNAVGDEFQVNQTTANDQLNSTVSLNAAGQFVISWTSNGQDGSGYGVYARSGQFGDNQTPRENQPPAASAQTATGNEDENLLITLSGTDPDSDPLTATITSLPTSGKLYQTADGVTLGAEITAPGTVVTDSQLRVIFVPADDAFGEPYATFEFTVSDGEATSDAATVTVNITSANDDPTVAATSNLVTVTEGQALANSGTFGDMDLSDSVSISASIGSITQDNGTWSWTLATTDDLPLTTVTITADDGNGGIVTTTFDVQATNSDPVIASFNNVTPGAPANPAGSPGQALQFSGTFSDAGTADTHTATVNWGDGSETENLTLQPLAGGGTISGGHTYQTAGTYTIIVTVTDDDGGQTERQFQVVIGTAALVPDTCNPGKLALVVNGTSKNDKIQIKKVGKQGDVRVIVNGKTVGTFRPTGRIIVYGLEGNDTITVQNTITNSAWLYGGEGNDRLYGGKGHDVLLGENGNDLLQGGAGRDLMIGGAGSDQLIGLSNSARKDDIPVGGWVVFPDQEEALCELMHTWTSSQPLAVRQAAVKSTLVPGMTVFTNPADKDRYTNLLLVVVLPS